MPLDLLVAATRNPAKARRYQSLLAQFARQVVSLDEVGVAASAPESGETAEENARLKAQFYARACGQAVFSDDAALYVDFLPPERQPGVHVRRLNGRDDASDEQLLAHWESLVAQAPAALRAGRWHVAFCLARPGGSAHTFTLDLPRVFFSPSSSLRIPGWPLNSLSGPPDFNRPSSELSPAELQQADLVIDRAITDFFARLP